MQQLVPLIRRALALPDLPDLAGESAAPCDIFAAEKQYELLLDAPGADPQDVNLELLEDHLSISITRPQASKRLLQGCMHAGMRVELRLPNAAALASTQPSRTAITLGAGGGHALPVSVG